MAHDHVVYSEGSSFPSRRVWGSGFRVQGFGPQSSTLNPKLSTLNPEPGLTLVSLWMTVAQDHVSLLPSVHTCICLGPPVWVARTCLSDRVLAPRRGCAAPRVPAFQHLASLADDRGPGLRGRSVQRPHLLLFGLTNVGAIWSHESRLHFVSYQFGEPGPISAPKLTDVYRKPCVSP